MSAFSQGTCWQPSAAPNGPRLIASCCRFSRSLLVFLCVMAEVWQPQWLRSLCTDPTYFLFPGQFAPMQQKAFGAILVLVGILDLEVARSFLSRPWLVARSKLSFPLYLVHWPILFGPAAALFLLLNGLVGIQIARVGAVAAGICLAFVASALFARPIAALWNCREDCAGACQPPLKHRGGQLRALVSWRPNERDTRCAGWFGGGLRLGRMAKARGRTRHPRSKPAIHHPLNAGAGR